MLDGAVLVLSAVEGVQPQTRILMRALQRLRVPTLLFVNKIDRAGADDDGVLSRLRAADAGGHCRWERRRGSARAPPPSRPTSGRHAFALALAELLAEHDEGILLHVRRGERVLVRAAARRTLAAQTERALVHPVFFGSAITGAGSSR